MTSDRHPMTITGKARLEAELKHLLQVERPEVVRAIEEARGHGDLSENADYDAAKERQAFCESRINDLQAKLAAADVGAHPLVGIGYGNLVFEQRHQSDFVMQRTAHATVPDILTKPHSWYLSVAVGTGLPGLVLGCWLLGKIGLTVHAAFLKAENWDTRCWLFGVLLMLGGFSIRLLFEDGFGGSHSYLFWILVASSLMISTNSGAKSLVSRQVMG